jgi:hypothetical protein
MQCAKAREAIAEPIDGTLGPIRRAGSSSTSISATPAAP